MRHKPALAGLVLLLLALAAAMLAGAAYPGDPFRITGKPFQPPFGEHLLGTDQLGRDLAAGVLYGARTTLLVGVVATLIATTLGVTIGGLAGYFGGAIDDVLMRFTEVFQTIPSFIFGILIVAIIAPSIGSTVTAISVVTWPPVARLVRGEVMAVRNREFVLACVAVGMGHGRLLLTQVLPNALPSLIVVGSLMVATAILFESGLAFLGLSDPNLISWGFMIGEGRDVLRTAWWLSAIPGVAILLTVLAINLVGEGLNDALNPRLRER
jgi:peptide/nickel transport system permease protein